jgi:cytochrome c
MKDMRREGLPRASLWAFGFLALGAAGSHAQMTPLTTVPKLTGAELFVQQCGTCHTLSLADLPRQGPCLAGIYGRKPGSVVGFHYSPGYTKADFVWDDAHLDTYLTNPQAIISDSNMLYKQSNSDIRKAIIAFLKDHK